MNERARLVEVAALDALDRSERLEPRVESLDALAQSAYGTAAKAEQDADEVRRAVAARWVLDHLGDASVWLTPSVMKEAQRKHAFNREWSINESAVRWADLFESWERRGYWVSSEFKAECLARTPYLQMPRWRLGGGTGFAMRREWEESIERTARERGAWASTDYIARTVRIVAEDVTIRLGFDCWTDRYVSVEYQPDNPDGPYRWKAHPR
jgi:hypothetical protein